MGQGARAIVGLALGLIVRVWLATLRVHVEYDAGLQAAYDRPWVLAFWHGTQWPLLAWRRRRPTVVLVSWSLDGALQARALAIQGLRVVRGSSSRGGVRGLATVVTTMKREGADAAFAVDGPRGPRGIVKPGAIMAARATGGVVVPIAGVVRSGVVLRGTWDAFAIAWPFTRVDVALGRPIEPNRSLDARGDVERALRQINAKLAGPFARAPCVG